VACAVYLPDFAKLSPAHKAAVDPYYMAFQEITKGLALRGAPIMSPDLLLKPNPKFPDDFKADPVGMVYAYQSRTRTAVMEHHQECTDKFAWADWMGTYSSASPKDASLCKRRTSLPTN